MKIAYKALYHQVLCEKEELVVRTEQLTDRLIEENVALRNIKELYKRTTLFMLASNLCFASGIIVYFWIIK